MEPTTAVAVYGEIDLPLLSVFGVLILLVVTLPLAAVLGWWSGMRHRAQRLSDTEATALVGETTLGAILAILGLLLAFSFGGALSYQQAIKAGQIDEAAALGTAFLRADMLEDPAARALQEALLAYAETRRPAQDAPLRAEEDVVAFLERTLQAQAALWPLTLEATADPTPPALRSFVAGAVNEVIDMHLYRIGALEAPVADHANLMLLATSIAALFLLGNRAGIQGRALTWRTFVLAGFLIVVMSTILDLQRPSDGLIRTSTLYLDSAIFDMRQALENG